MNEEAILAWLLEGDPSIRWQALRDLAGVDDGRYISEQALVAEQGWGAQLLALQEPSGRWGGGLYGPKWISTHYTLMTLCQLGVPPGNPGVRRAAFLLLDSGFYQDGGINYFNRRIWKHSETCITGMLLAMLAHLRVEDERLDRMAKHLLGQQMADGGWNCETYRGATHASFHTTLSVLEGLEGYRKFCLDSPGGKGQELAEVEAAQARGHEFLLWHNLFRSHRTGEVFDGRMLRFPFPPRYRYDVLRALDYFQGVKVTNASVNSHNHIIEKDARFEDAIALLRKKRRPDGRWDMYAGMSGRIYFELEKAGQPSRWNTLRGLRVLKWWEALR